MDIFSATALGFATLLFAYLLAALLKPELFE